MGLKTGRLKNDEKKYIIDNVKHMDYVTIAKALNRRPVSIQNYIEEDLDMVTNLSENDMTGGIHVPDITDREFWPILKKQFDKDELKVFKHHWVQIFTQFKGDVVATEELQIIDTIKYEILMDRNLTDQYGAEKMMKQLEVDIALESAKPRDQDSPDGCDKNLLFQMNQQISVLAASKSQTSKQFIDLQDKKNRLLNSMKATRADRYNDIDKSKESFTSWMKELLTNPSKRYALGIEMEKRRLAMEKEKGRLTQYHQYEDGIVDQPFLNHETVKEDNGRNKQNES